MERRERDEDDLPTMCSKGERRRRTLAGVVTAGAAWQSVHSPGCCISF